MKTTELKKLAKEFTRFIEDDFEDIEGQMRQFWFATFRCNNEARESELLEFWKNF